MGERGNIFVPAEGVQTTPTGIYLYTQWRGASTLAVARHVLRKRLRWGDPDYLTRILFCALIEEPESEEIGFGIGTVLCDHNYPSVVVDTITQRVGVAEPGCEHAPIVSWSFEDFAAMTPKVFADVCTKFGFDAELPRWRAGAKKAKADGRAKAKGELAKGI